MLEKHIDFIIYKTIPVLVLLFGLVGNLLGILVFNRKRMNFILMGPRQMYLYLFKFDSFAMLQLVVIFFTNELKGKKTEANFSNISCKLFRYLNNIINIISPMMLIYISLDRLISVRFPEKRSILRKPLNQKLYILGVIIVNAAIYLPSFLFIEKQKYSDFLGRRGLNNSHLNQTDIYICEYKSFKVQFWIRQLFFLNRILIPFLVMSGISIYIVSIINRVRGVHQRRSRGTNCLVNDVIASITCFCLNFSYLVLATPICFYTLKVDMGYLDLQMIAFLGEVYYLSYGINFYIIYFSNSIFRKEFKKLINHNRRRNGRHHNRIFVQFRWLR